MLLFMLLIPNAYAQGVPDSGAIDELLRTFETAAGLWPPVLRQYATYVFVALVTISWSWTFLDGFQRGQHSGATSGTHAQIGNGWFFLLAINGRHIDCRQNC